MKMHPCLFGMLPVLATTSVLANPIYSTDFETSTSAGAGWSSTLRSQLGGPYTTVLGRFGSRGVGFDLHATAENTAGLNNGGGNIPGTGVAGISVRPYDNDRQPQPMYDGGGAGVGGVGGNGSHDPDLPTVNLGQAVQDAHNPGSGSGEIIFGAGTYALTFDLMLFDSWDGNYDGYGPDSFAVDINGQRLFDELLETLWLPNNFRLPDELPELNVYSQSWRDVIYRDITIEFEVSEATDLFRFGFVGTLDQSITDESWGIDNVRVDQVSTPASRSANAVPATSTLALIGAGVGLGSRRRRGSN